ncbi:MAG: winged helix-turn-helix transcriptional regulator [Burkholderiales bacterium]|nr:MAG: winged helix-turn-helix transcriptional regulator [Burkholderiales bacterium]
MTPLPASQAPFVDEDLVFRVLRLANLIARPFQGSFGTRFDLSLAEWRVVLVLAAHPRVSATEVAERTGMHVMNVSRSVARLVRMGRVTRGVDPSDRRRAVLRLTRKGLAMYRQIAPSAQAREEAVRQVLSTREKAQLRAMLDRLSEHVQASGAGSEPAR